MQLREVLYSIVMAYCTCKRDFFREEGGSLLICLPSWWHATLYTVYCFWHIGVISTINGIFHDSPVYPLPSLALSFFLVFVVTHFFRWIAENAHFNYHNQHISVDRIFVQLMRWPNHWSETQTAQMKWANCPQTLANAPSQQLQWKWK